MSSKPQQPDLSIVIPAYREENRIGATLDELAIFLKHNSFFKQREVEVIVVAADAPDRTREIVAAKQQLFKRFQLLEPGPKVGKGRDVQFGVLRANGKVVLFMDADLATPLHHLEEFYTAIQQGNDVVVGIRNQFTRRPSAIRRTISNLGNSLFSLASGVGFEDTQCGFKIFTNHAAKLCFSKLTTLGWWFDIEVLVIAQVNGLHISSLPLSDWIVKPYSTFEENDLSIVGSYVRDVFRITMNRLRGAYAEKSLNS